MRAIVMIGLGVSLGLLAGCTPTQNAQVNQGVQGLGQGAAQATANAKQAASDAALEAKVKAVLTSRKGLNAGNIDVEARGSAVTLTGHVQSREQATLAEQATKEIEGVGSVTNELMMSIPATGGAAGATGATTTPSTPSTGSGH